MDVSSPLVTCEEKQHAGSSAACLLLLAIVPVLCKIAMALLDGLWT
jgi:hypothetical protein